MKKTFISGYIQRMLPTIIMSQIVMTICTVIDTALSGQFLGAEAVAAEGMVTPVALVVLAVAVVMSAGNSIICSNASGKGDTEEINQVFSTTLTVSLAISIVCTLLILMFASTICQALGLTPGTGLFSSTLDYMLGYVPMMPILTVITTLPAILQIEGDRQTNVVAVSLVFVLDIAFDLLNLFVFHGGVLGMALATTLSGYVAGTVMLLCFFGKKRTARFSLRLVKLGRVGEIMSYGTPAFVNSMCLGLTAAALNVAFLQYGSEPYVAAFTIVAKVGEILLCFGNGMGDMTAMVTGIANGEEDRDGLKEIIAVMCRKAIMINAVLIVLCWLIGDLAVRLFTDDTIIIALGTFGLRIFALQFIFRGLVLCYVGYLRGLKRFMMGNAILIVMAASAALFARIAPEVMGVEAVWYSYLVSVACALAFVILLVGFSMKRNPFSLDGLILQPDSYGLPAENYLEWEIADIPQLCECCKTAEEFVKEHGGNRQQAFRLSLFMEEMGKNVLDWSFGDGKSHRLMLKVMFSNGEFVLRIRDDGAQFDPKEYYSLHKSDNPDEKIGIRLVLGMASEVTYLNTMNLNNLLLKV